MKQTIISASPKQKPDYDRNYCINFHLTYRIRAELRNGVIKWILCTQRRRQAREEHVIYEQFRVIYIFKANKFQIKVNEKHALPLSRNNFVNIIINKQLAHIQNTRTENGSSSSSSSKKNGKLICSDVRLLQFSLRCLRMKIIINFGKKASTLNKRPINLLFTFWRA